jgi:hypothetical protein
MAGICDSDHHAQERAALSTTEHARAAEREVRGKNGEDTG